MTALAYLSDPTDPRTIAALKLDCGICGAKPRQPCRQPDRSAPPLNRIVHLERATAKMHKRRYG